MRPMTWTAVALACLLGGCGAEVASSGAAVTTLQATQAEQAGARAAHVKAQLAAAARRPDAAASAAEQ